MTRSKLPRRFAVLGIAVGLTFAALYWYDYTYNPFHFPTWEKAPPNYSAPPVYQFLEKLMFTLCPGLLLQIFTIHTGTLVTLTMWAFAVLVNGPIYYCAGLILARLMKVVARREKPGTEGT